MRPPLQARLRGQRCGHEGARGRQLAIREALGWAPRGARDSRPRAQPRWRLLRARHLAQWFWLTWHRRRCPLISSSPPLRSSTQRHTTPRRPARPEPHQAVALSSLAQIPGFYLGAMTSLFDLNTAPTKLDGAAALKYPPGTPQDVETRPRSVPLELCHALCLSVRTSGGRQRRLAGGGEPHSVRGVSWAICVRRHAAWRGALARSLIVDSTACKQRTKTCKPLHTKAECKAVCLAGKLKRTCAAGRLAASVPWWTRLYEGEDNVLGAGTSYWHNIQRPNEL